MLATTYCNPTAICYCGNKHDTQNTDTKEIKFLSAKSHDFGKEMNPISVELSNHNTFIQSLLRLGSFLHGKTIEFFDNPTNYPPVIANDLKSGKIVGTKIISDALLSPNYRFMDDENLKDLKKLLSQG